LNCNVAEPIALDALDDLYQLFDFAFRCRSPWKLKIQTGIVDGEQSVGFFLGNEDTVDHDVNYKLVIQQTSKCLQSKIPKDEWWGFPQFMTKTKFVADNSADIKADIVRILPMMLPITLCFTG
jgi:hypothetical protein